MKKYELTDISTYRNEIFGFCAVLIFLFHGAGTDTLSVHDVHGLIKPLYLFISYGNIGVDIFLFLSGIGLFYSFQKDNNAYHFFTRRLSRVLIPYLVISVPLLAMKDYPGKAAFFNDITWVSLFTEGNRSVWYVAAILLFYLIYPYIYGFLFDKEYSGKKLFLRSFTLLFLWVCFVRLLKAASPDFYDDIEIILNRFPIFFAGCALSKSIYNHEKVPGAFVIAATVFVLAAYVFFAKVRTSVFVQRYIYFLLSIALCVVLSVCFRLIKSSRVHSVFSWLGSYSLEIYLIHVLLRGVLMKYDFFIDYIWIKWMLLFPVTLVLSILTRKISTYIQTRLASLHL